MTEAKTPYQLLVWGFEAFSLTESWVHYWEHIGYYCYLEDALYYMNPSQPAKWKTLDRQVTLRQDIRENTVQWICLEDLLFEGMTQKDDDTFIGIARVYDRRHHGHETF